MTTIVLLRGWYKGIYINCPYKPCVYSNRNWLDIFQDLRYAGISNKLAQNKEDSIKTLNALRLDIFLKFKNNYVTLRRLRKHWGQDFNKNICLWFSSLYYLMRTSELPNDETNGWEWFTQEELDREIEEKSYIAEPDIYDYCDVCNVECSKKCSICRKAYYCCDAHQNEDWEKHKMFCKITELGQHVIQIQQIVQSNTEIKEQLKEATDDAILQQISEQLEANDQKLNEHKNKVKKIKKFLNRIIA